MQASNIIKPLKMLRKDENERATRKVFGTAHETTLSQKAAQRFYQALVKCKLIPV
jgi:hypothetical protein